MFTPGQRQCLLPISGADYLKAVGFESQPEDFQGSWVVINDQNRPPSHRCTVHHYLRLLTCSTDTPHYPARNDLKKVLRSIQSKSDSMQTWRQSLAGSSPTTTYVANRNLEQHILATGNEFAVATPFAVNRVAGVDDGNAVEIHVQVR